MSTIIPAQPGWVVDYRGKILTVIAWRLIGDILEPMVYQPELGHAASKLPDGSTPTARRLVKDSISKQWV